MVGGQARRRSISGWLGWAAAEIDLSFPPLLPARPTLLRVFRRGKMSFSTKKGRRKYTMYYYGIRAQSHISFFLPSFFLPSFFLPPSLPPSPSPHQSPHPIYIPFNSLSTSNTFSNLTPSPRSLIPSTSLPPNASVSLGARALSSTEAAAGERKASGHEGATRRYTRGWLGDGGRGTGAR